MKYLKQIFFNIKQFFIKHPLVMWLAIFGSISSIIPFFTGIPNIPYLLSNETSKIEIPSKDISLLKDTTSNNQRTDQINYDLDKRILLDYLAENSDLSKIFDYSLREINYFKNNGLPLVSAVGFNMLDSSIVEKFDFINSNSRKKYYFGHYTFPKIDKEDRHRAEGIVIFEGDNESDLIQPKIIKINFFGFDGSGGFLDPSIINTSVGKILFIPIYTGGNGIFNLHQYFLITNSKLEKIESENWKNDFEIKLQNGDHTMNGIEIDLKSMTAKTDIWKKDDAHCCPTGGQAEIKLTLDNKSIKLVRYIIKPKVDI